MAHWGALLPGPLRRGRWNVGLIRQPIESVIRERRLAGPTWLRSEPPGRYYADPFPLRVEADRATILVEEFDHATQRGRIAELDIAADGTLLGTRYPVQLEHHASYPFLLRVAGRPLCVPETHESGRASAFEIDDDGWRPAATLLSAFPAVDSTLIEHDGRWWLFCTRPDDHGTLFLFSADDWHGPFEPHPLNPVKRDLGSAPAGGLVRVDDQLYRPAQDCRRNYGGAIAINRVLELSRTSFREELSFRLEPAPGGPWPHGLHTINGLDGVTVVDGKRYEWGGWPW